MLRFCPKQYGLSDMSFMISRAHLIEQFKHRLAFKRLFYWLFPLADEDGLMQNSIDTHSIRELKPVCVGESGRVSPQ